MKKILLIDYYGMCDRQGRAVGHSPKVLEEYRNLLEKRYEVGAAVSPCLKEAGSCKFDKVYELKYDISVEDSMSVIKRILDKYKILINIVSVLKIDSYDVYWFYKTDFFLFFFFYFMCFVRRKEINKKIFIAQIYQGSFGDQRVQRLLNWFYKKGMSRFDGIMYSQKQAGKLHSNMLYFPDYYYDTEKYAIYKNVKKESKVVCLGTMNPYKKLDTLVEVFNRNGYPLEIKGCFFDKDFYRNLCSRAKPNIVIEDGVLSEREYYETLAGAKYTILPYDMNQYQCRTSGILVESMFLDTTAIAPLQLLQENQVKGIGYEKIEELLDISFFKEKPCPDNSIGKRDFDQKVIRERLEQFIDAL